MDYVPGRDGLSMRQWQVAYILEARHLAPDEIIAWLGREHERLGGRTPSTAIREEDWKAVVDAAYSEPFHVPNEIAAFGRQGVAIGRQLREWAWAAYRAGHLPESARSGVLAGIDAVLAWAHQMAASVPPESAVDESTSNRRISTT